MLYVKGDACKEIYMKRYKKIAKNVYPFLSQIILRKWFAYNCVFVAGYERIPKQAILRNIIFLKFC